RRTWHRTPPAPAPVPAPVRAAAGESAGRHTRTADRTGHRGCRARQSPDTQTAPVMPPWRRRTAGTPPAPACCAAPTREMPPRRLHASVGATAGGSLPIDTTGTDVTGTVRSAVLRRPAGPPQAGRTVPRDPLPAPFFTQGPREDPGPAGDAGTRRLRLACSGTAGARHPCRRRSAQGVDAR